MLIIIVGSIFSGNILTAASVQPASDNAGPKSFVRASQVEGGDAKIGSQIKNHLKSGALDNISVVMNLRGEYAHLSSVLKRLGFTVERAQGTTVQGHVKANDLARLASLRFVDSIREPAKPIFASVESEGVDVLKANIAHSIGQTGKGVKVAVIDGGFDVNNPKIASKIVEAKSFINGKDVSGDYSHHGTACAEIVVDVAPDVQLYLYAVRTDLDFVAAVNRAVSKHVNIISTSLSFANLGPYDGSSDTSKALENARKAGVLPIVAASNMAQVHWSGTFQDPDSNNWVNFDGTDETNTFHLDQNNKVTVYLSWNRWWQTNQDYDLYLYRAVDGNLTEVSRSTNRQNGNYWPTEEVDYTATVSGQYAIKIIKVNADGKAKFDMFAYGASPLKYRNETGSLMNIADAKGAISVGALYWKTNALEPFSSRGPTADGRIKPDIMGPDGVTTTGYTPFFGTSAAAPHIAGLAALIAGSNPSLTADEIEAILENTTTHLGAAGKNGVYGYGQAGARYVTLDVSPRTVPLIVDGNELSPTLLPRKILVDGMPRNVSLPITSTGTNNTRYIFKQWSSGNKSQTITLRFDGRRLNETAQFAAENNNENSTKGAPQGIWYNPNTGTSLSSLPTTNNQDGT
ncbi:MAG: S8 family serine peptidase [Thaumarchaeota archaeon]|nr:S8 family serine peptidase [Nitrososphaerota archaeon]MCL5317158.1 S8 family serine peptidase [Nitrososphaerota archaeon]